jgi:hypothetical protein
MANGFFKDFYFVYPNLDKPKPNRTLSWNLACYRFGLSKLASKIYEA